MKNLFKKSYLKCELIYLKLPLRKIFTGRALSPEKIPKNVYSTVLCGALNRAVEP
jgi:hypothetical protein